MSDLMTRLTEAAVGAIRNEAPSLTHRPETIRGITIELTLASAGQLNEVICYLERRTKAGALLGRQTIRAKGA